MPQTDYEAAVAMFLRTKSITRCPTVCAVPTQATVADHDRAAYRDHVAAREAARHERTKSLHHLVHPWAASPL
ncbi:MAG TPA: hypothetical protein VMF05_07720 [Stellaceae bacterium]|nr:hypothetical protein [Stellaceae bacterium]